MAGKAGEGLSSIELFEQSQLARQRMISAGVRATERYLALGQGERATALQPEQDLEYVEASRTFHSTIEALHPRDYSAE